MAKNCTTIEEAKKRIRKILREASRMDLQDNPIDYILTGFKSVADDVSPALNPEIIEYLESLIKKNLYQELNGVAESAKNLFIKGANFDRIRADIEEKARNLSQYEETVVRKSQVKQQLLKGLFGENLYTAQYYLRSAKNGFGLVQHSSNTGIPGLIDTFLANRKNQTLVRNQDIAENVRETKQALLDKVLEFMRNQKRNQGYIDRKVFDKENTRLFDRNGEYLNTLNQETELYKVIMSWFDPKNIAMSNNLDTKYNLFKVENDSEAREYIDAYTAWTLLTNFDTTLTLVLRDSVLITEPSNFNKISNVSYRTNIDKATNMWSFGFGDDVEDVGDLISDITKQLVESSKRYSWKADVPKQDSYLSFKDFNYIIGKVKDLVFTLKGKSDIELEYYINGVNIITNEKVWNLSRTTQEVYENFKEFNKSIGKENEPVTLGQLIAFSSENPMRSLHAIFDILCNTDILTNQIESFTDADKDLLWSCYKEIFGQCGENSRSLFDLHHNTKGDTIFSIIAQIADTMFQEDIIQYYEDDNKTLYAQLMRDYTINQIRNELAQQIQQSFSFTLSTENIKFTNKQQLTTTAKEAWKVYTGENTIPVETELISEIKIPVKITKNGRKIKAGEIIVTATNIKFEQERSIAGEDIWNSGDFRELIKDTTGIDFEADPDLAQAYKGMFSGTSGVNYTALLDNITRIVGYSVFNNYFNTKLVPQILNQFSLTKDQPNINNIAYSQFTNVKSIPRVDPKTGLIPSIPSADKNIILDKLSQAKSISNNIYTSAQVKTGEGTALAAYCLSRLRNSYQYQLVTQNRADWSASKGMTFVENKNGLFNKVFTSREIKLSATVKPSTDMSSVELWSLNFYNDWVSAFVGKARTNSPNGDGACCFIPSVNSDKGQYDKLGCNLNALSHILDEKGNPIAYRNLTPQQIVEEIRMEFGPFYRNVINNITKEWDRVLSVLLSNESLITDADGNKTTQTKIYEGVIANINKIANPAVKWKAQLSFVDEYFSTKGIKTLDGLHKVITKYNMTHTRNPIRIAEQIHYTKGDNGLAINKVLVAQWARFDKDVTAEDLKQAKISQLYYRESLDQELSLFFLSPTSAATISKEQFDQIPSNNPLKEEVRAARRVFFQSTAEGFFKMRDFESVIKLLKNGCKIYLYGAKAREQNETDFLRNFGKTSKDGVSPWVTDSGMMAFVRVTGDDGIMYPTNDFNDLIRAQNLGRKWEIHPLISMLNRMDYLTTQQYTCCVGGATYVYKGKSGSNVLEEEANRWLASNKRNVCYTATIHKFLNKLLNGSPTVYNYAIFDDINAALYNVMGELNTHTPLDGGMLVNSFLPDLENASLGGEAAGTDKKHFGTFYVEEYGAGGITKTAGFAATNERMRNSEAWRIVQYNMSRRKWVKEFGNANGDILETELDITKDYDGNDINWPDKEIFYYRELEDGTINFYRLANIIKTANSNEYEIYEVPVDEYGTDKGDIEYRETAVIDNNWDLFTKVFGGYHSLSREVSSTGVENPNSKLTYSEKSRKLMVEAINRIGYRKISANSYPMIDKLGNERDAYTKAATREQDHEDDQDDVWQPLKYADIHFMPNIGAIKSTQMNVNPPEAISQKMDLNVMPVERPKLGIQLDKEHSADDAELSMPTQIITACANKGYVLTKTTEMYRAISTLTELAIEDCMDGIMDLVPGGENRGLLKAKIAQIIVEKLVQSRDDNEALHAVLGFLEDKVKAGGKISPEDVQNIPWSDTLIYNKLYSDIASHLTNQAIKLKISGSLAVICPTHYLERLYGNKRLSSLIELIPGGLGEKLALLEYQRKIREENYEGGLIYDRTRDSKKNKTELLNQTSKINTQHIYHLEYINPLTGEVDSNLRQITINYPMQYYQLRDEIVKFRQASQEELKGAYAQTNSDGTILISNIEDINPEAFYAYINGEAKDDKGNVIVSSEQKRRVFKQLEESGYTIDSLKKLLGNDPRKILAFLKFHELSHKQHNDNRGRNPLLHHDTITLEARATKEAWDKMLEIEAGSINAQKYLREISELNAVYEAVCKQEHKEDGTIEIIPLGRELSAYNVRFTSPSTVVNGKYRPYKEFCIYDLDSVKLLFEVINDTKPKKGYKLDEIEGYFKNQLNTMAGIRNYIYSRQELYKNINKIQASALRYIETKYPNELRNFTGKNDATIEADPKLEKIAAEAFRHGLKLYLRNWLQEDLIKLSLDYKGDRLISIGGEEVSIDGDSITPIAFELIMPKIYKTIFGLQEGDDLQRISEDKNFFTRRGISRLKNKIENDSLYDYQLKRFTGDHMYIFDANHGPIPQELILSPNFHLFTEQDGSYSRVDVDGNVIYPLSSKDDVVMMTADGVEVIVTKNPAFFIENNNSNAITFSNSRVDEKRVQDMVDKLQNSTTSNGKRFIRTFTKKNGDIKNFSALKKRNRAFADLREDLIEFESTGDVDLDSLVAEISQEGQKVHASFLKSLDVIAGRIPAQSQQSFMTQKVVAFTNSDINSAYVSTFQLFIQGSDLDIDTVNLIGAGFDRQGHYVLWSPYANLGNSELIKASEQLPFPTGQATEITYDNNKDSFFITFNDFFGKDRLFNIELDPSTGDIVRNKQGVYKISFNSESPEAIKQLAKFLKLVETVGLNLKGGVDQHGNHQYSKELDEEIYAQNLKYKNLRIFTDLHIKPSQLLNVLQQIKEIVDKNNLYIKEVDKRTKEIMAKNLSYCRMFEIAGDPANQMEAQDSIDNSTKIIKGSGGAVEAAMTEEDKNQVTSNNEKYSLPNPVSTVDALQTNQVGKKGVSIGAKGVQGNSMVQYAYDSLLNSDMPDKVKRRLELPSGGHRIAGKQWTAIANLHDKTYEETGEMQQPDFIKEMLKVLDDETVEKINSAVQNAAMLSVAVDNAKDLSLGKINAGPAMFGMYVYGITLGIDIVTLAKIMNSPQGRAISKVLQGNVFTGDIGFSNVLQAINFLNGKNLTGFLTQFDYANNRGSRTLFDIFRNIAAKKLSANQNDKCARDIQDYKTSNIAKVVEVLVKYGQLNRYLDQIQQTNSWEFSKKQLFEALKEYSALVQQWRGNKERKHDLEVLSQGAEEMRVLGVFLGSNKGVKTKIEDGINFINTLENVISDRYRIKNPNARESEIASYKIDYLRFCTDPEYREQCIDQYDKVKHSINILQVVALCPHILSYLRASIIPHAGFMSASSKYRSTQAIINSNIYNTLGIKAAKDKSNSLKGLNNEINAMMLMQWLSDTKKVFYLPKEQYYFKAGTNELIRHEGSSPLPIPLWTPEGLATFKLYMEQSVLPKLKRESALKNNKFVMNLIPFALSQTGTRATVSAYTLTGNLLPKAGSAEEALLREYQAAFNVVKNKSFPYRKDVSGLSTIVTYGDALYLYSEYVFGGRKGPNSLMALFEQGNNELQKQFREAKANMDQNRDFNLTTMQKLRSMALMSNVFNPKYSYYYAVNNTDIGVYFYENEEKTLTPQEKEMRIYGAAEYSEYQGQSISKRVKRGQREYEKGEEYVQNFLYPELKAPSTQKIQIGAVQVTFQNNKITDWDIIPIVAKNSFNIQGENSTEIMKKFKESNNDEIKNTVTAIENAIKMINDNLDMTYAGVYVDGAVITQIRNLDIVQTALELAILKGTGKCK